MGTGSSGVSVPMSGPSTRTMTIAAVAIALAGIGVGAVIGWRALGHGPPAVAAPPPPETNVALVEQPEMLPEDGGVAVEAPDPPPLRAAHSNPRLHGSTSNGPAGASASNNPSAHSSNSAGASQDNSANTNSGAAVQTHTPAGHPATNGSTNAGAGTHADTSQNGSRTTAADLAALRAGGDPGAPQGPSVAGYRQGDTTDATGTMDPHVFSFVYSHYRPQISACHSMVSRGDEVRGTMRVRIRLGTDGHVVRTRVMSNTTNNDALAECVQDSIHSWHYPQPEGGEVEFDYNFGFGN